MIKIKQKVASLSTPILTKKATSFMVQTTMISGIKKKNAVNNVMGKLDGAHLQNIKSWQDYPLFSKLHKIHEFVLLDILSTGINY